MPQLSGEQVYALARKAGLPANRAVIATAIAGGAGSPSVGESGGNTTAHNPVPPDDSYGLWQINMIDGLGPARRALFRLKSNEELYDPRTNARAMAGISTFGLNFGPWSVYTRGTYRNNLDWARAAAARAEAQGIDKVIAGVGHGAIGPGTEVAGTASGIHIPGTDTLGKIAAAVGNVGDAAKWLSTAHNWWRIAGVVAGAIMVIIALMTLLRPIAEPAAKAAVGIASKVPV